jgi:hypothetical protein
MAQVRRPNTRFVLVGWLAIVAYSAAVWFFIVRAVA